MRMKYFAALLTALLAMVIAISGVSASAAAQPPSPAPDASSTGTYSYEQQLNEAEKGVYQAILQNLASKTASFTYAFPTPVDVGTPAAQNSAISIAYRAYEAVYRDHPEIFWVTKAGGIKTSIAASPGGTSASTMDMTVVFNEPTKVEQKQQALEAAVSGILAKAPASVYDKLKYFHDTITAKSDYDMDARNNPTAYPDSFEAYGALVYGKAVCEGYAKSFKLLCDRSGIPCVIIGGSANGEQHMWNYVQIDGKWYLVDATFDDPVGGTPNSATFLKGSSTTGDHSPGGGFIQGFNGKFTDPPLNAEDYPRPVTEEPLPDASSSSAASSRADQKEKVKSPDPPNGEPAWQSYTVNYAPADGGYFTVSYGKMITAIDSGQTITKGAPITVRAYPFTGYEVSSITVEMAGETATESSKDNYTFTMDGDCNISVQFKEKAGP